MRLLHLYNALLKQATKYIYWSAGFNLSKLLKEKKQEFNIKHQISRVNDVVSNFPCQEKTYHEIQFAIKLFSSRKSESSCIWKPDTKKCKSYFIAMVLLPNCFLGDEDIKLKNGLINYYLTVFANVCKKTL